MPDLYRGFIAGFNISRASDTVINVQDGSAVTESYPREMMEMLDPGIIDITQSNSSEGIIGGLGSPRLAGTWYSVFCVYKGQQSPVLYAEIDYPPLHLPAGGYTEYRRVGSFYLDENAEIDDNFFISSGNSYAWAEPVLSVNDNATGTLAVIRKVHVPTKIHVIAVLHVMVINPSSPTGVYVSSLSSNDEPPNSINAPLATLWSVADGPNELATQVTVGTSKNQEIRTRNVANETLRIVTLGWIDERGRGE